LGCKSTNCDGKTCGGDGVGGSCGTCKENETCVDGVCKCGTLDSCKNFCIKDSTGKYKCCEKTSCSAFDLNHCGTDECTGERCYCPVGFSCNGTECVCGPYKKVCDINDTCVDFGDQYSCSTEFTISTQHGVLSNIIEDVGNGAKGIRIISRKSENYFSSNIVPGRFTYPNRSHLEIITNYEKNTKRPLYVDYESKINSISLTKGSYIQRSKNNTLIYRKPGHGARFYLTVFTNSKGVSYAIPGPYYSGFVFSFEFI
jgi:hypothetical protein